MQKFSPEIVKSVQILNVQRKLSKVHSLPIFCQIPEVLLWPSEQSEELSPHLTMFTEHFNKMSYWYCSLSLLLQYILVLSGIIISSILIVFHRQMLKKEKNNEKKNHIILNAKSSNLFHLMPSHPGKKFAFLSPLLES